MKAFLSAGSRDRFRKRINRAPSPFLARSLPWFTVVLGSIVPGWMVISSAPLLPPLGFLILIAWCQLRPGLLPVWAGLPLGLCDDLFSGQPMGSGVLLWSVAVILLDVIESRLPWRNFVTEWLVAAALIVAYIVTCLGIANMAGGSAPLSVVAPQAILAALLYPAIGRMVAAFDRLRLFPFREVG